MTLEEEGKAKAIDKNHIRKGRSIGEIIISLLSLSRRLMGFSRSSNFTDKKKLAFLVDNHNQNLQEEEGEEDHHSKFLSTSPFMASTSSNSTTNKAIFNNNQTNPLDHHHHHQHINIHNYGINMQSSSSSSIGNFISKDNMGSGNNSTNLGAYDLGELDQALFLYLDGQQADTSTTSNHLHQDQRHHNTSGMRPPTLNIFPSQPMHVDPSSTKASSGLAVSSAQGGSMSGSKRGSDHPILLSNNMDLVNNSTTATTSTTSITRNDITTTTALSASPSAPDNHNNQPATANKAIKREGNRKGPTSSSEQEGPKTPDPKTLRRLAQNREAARKSRLRKKAYVQQLESSRIKLTQIEQELQRARSQGMFFGGGAALVGGEQGIPVGIGNISPDAAVFDMEYARWLEEHHRIMCELRAAVQEHIPENELRIFVDNCLAHYDQFLSLKSMVAKTDVFHIVSGMWKTPAERCFMWMGGFRPSEIIKIILSQIEPLTEQQILGICGLQQSTQEAEEALSQGLEALNQSLSDTIAADSLSCPPNMTNYMGQMALAMNKLSTLEGFVRQADNLRQQTIHRMQQILTTRQAARCLLAIAEYFHRLRALSSLWLARPRQDQ